MLRWHLNRVGRSGDALLALCAQGRAELGLHPARTLNFFVAPLWIQLLTEDQNSVAFLRFWREGNVG
jgi:hypothetical protein